LEEIQNDFFALKEKIEEAENIKKDKRSEMI
jgi:hypothetical protein